MVYMLYLFNMPFRNQNSLSSAECQRHKTLPSMCNNLENALNKHQFVQILTLKINKNHCAYFFITNNYVCSILQLYIK